ncbi:hypothetical protein N9H34_00100 [bacterium]|nr:hypothetical protein [bacterium]
MATCANSAGITDIEELLEQQIIDWMLDVKNNIGLLNNLEDIYSETTIVSNNNTSETSMFAMTDEMARIKYKAKEIYTTASGHKSNIDAMIQAQCAAMNAHETVKNQWLAYRDGFLPVDPEYTNATNKANIAEGHRATKESEIATLRSDANTIIGQIDAQFVQIPKGVLNARYDCNISVGSLVSTDIQEPANPYYVVPAGITNAAYALTVLNKIGKWAEFAQDLNITTKLKSITFNHSVPNGTGSLNSIITALSARDSSFNDDNELVVASDMEYKLAIVAAYGPEIITAASTCKTDIVSEYNFLQDILVTSVTNQTIAYSSSTNAWTPTPATFQPESWYDARNAELDVLPDPYDPDVPAVIDGP